MPPQNHGVGSGARRRAGRGVPGAQAAIGQARRIEPNNLTYQLRELTLCPIVFQSVQEIDNYRQELEARLDKLLERGEAIPLETLMKTGFMPPYGLSYQGRCDLAIKEKFAEVVRRSVQGAGTGSQGSGNGEAKRVSGAGPLTHGPSPAAGRGEPEVPARRGAGRPRKIGIVVTYGHEAIALRSLAGVIPRLEPCATRGPR